MKLELFIHPWVAFLSCVGFAVGILQGTLKEQLVFVALVFAYLDTVLAKLFSSNTHR